MGYILELRAGRLSHITEELAQPTIEVSEVDGMGDAVNRTVASDWHRFQRVTAEAVQAGRPLVVDGDVADYITTVIRLRSNWWDALQHTSSGGSEFRAELTDDVGAMLGVTLVAGLVNRPILGLEADDHPMFGWADFSELSRAVSAIATLDLPPIDQQSSMLRAFLKTIRAAAERGLDLVTVST